MLPTPRLSARISSRRAASGDTSRIARRVPSPLSAMPHNTAIGSTAQAQSRATQPAANCKLSLPELSTRHAGSPSRIPGPLGETSCPTSEQSDASSLISAPRPKVKKADARYPTPPPSARPKDEQRLKPQEGRTVPTQHHELETRNPAAASSPRLQQPTAGTRRPTSTAFAAGSSRIENTSSGDGAGAGALAPPARKKSSFTTSVSGKENRQPRLRTRVPPPPVMPPVAVVPSVPPRAIRRTVAVVAQPSHASFCESPPRPLVVKRRRSDAPAVGSPQGDSRVRSAAASAPLGFLVEIKALMEDIDCFAKEWTVMFEELSTGADGPEGRPSKFDLLRRIHPTVQPESAGTCQADDPAMKKRTRRRLLSAPSGSTGSVSTSQASPLVRNHCSPFPTASKYLTGTRLTWSLVYFGPRSS